MMMCRIRWSVRTQRVMRYYYHYCVWTGILPCLLVLCVIGLVFFITARSNTLHDNTKTSISDLDAVKLVRNIRASKGLHLKDSDIGNILNRISKIIENNKTLSLNNIDDNSYDKYKRLDKVPSDDDIHFDNIVDNRDKSDETVEENNDNISQGYSLDKGDDITTGSLQNYGVGEYSIFSNNNGNRSRNDVTQGIIFEFASNLGKLAHDKILQRIELEKVSTFEVGLGRRNGSERLSKGGDGDGGADGEEGKGKDAFPPFVEKADEQGPGEHGKDVRIPKDKLSVEERQQRDAEYKINYFDLWVSRMISIHRRLDDSRDDRCHKKSYDVTSLPPVSVVMAFHNEAWTTLLRSIHSIMDRTPPGALLEIVLLDDASEQDHLGLPLEKYLKPFQKVRLVRSIKRLGLIKARNLGFLYARGDIVVFLDSHIECFPGWLEPLVTPIVLDPRTVTFPTIPSINTNTFGLGTPSKAKSSNPIVFVGNVNIHTLMFYWTPTNDTGRQYYESPAMPGGLYAISRKWFRHLGLYDPMLMVWGGENVEISFKTWMCGGRILLSTCSWVGHVFRSHSPLKKEDYVSAMPWNSNRVAEVWMDQYKHFYFEKVNYNIGPVGDVSVQKDLRRGLMCKSFGWYLNNVNLVMKKQIDPRSVYFGKVRNKKTNRCLGQDHKTGGVKMMSCDVISYLQLWNLRTNGHFQCYDQVMTFHIINNGTSYRIKMLPASTSLKDKIMSFDYSQAHHLVHKQSQLCLDVDTSLKTLPVILSVCRSDVISQIWTLQPRMQFRESHEDKVTGIEW